MLISLHFNEEKLNRGFVDIKKANEIAVKNTLNTMAFLTRRNAIKNIKNNFIIRNQFTERQIRVEKETGSNYMSISQMRSSVGATEKAKYMEKQEKGGTRQKVNIPQPIARNNSIRNLVSKKNYLKNIRKNMVKGRFKRKTSSRKAQLVAQAYIADKTNKFLFYKNSIFIISNFKKTKGVSFKKKLIYNKPIGISRIKSNKWLEPAYLQPVRDGQNIYNSQIKKMLRQREII